MESADSDRHLPPEDQRLEQKDDMTGALEIHSGETRFILWGTFVDNWGFQGFECVRTDG